MQEKVVDLIPEEDKLEITTLSGNAFYYFGQQELRNKLLLIEDLDGADEVLYPLREIKSKKRISKTVVIKNTKGETRTVTLGSKVLSAWQGVQRKRACMKTIRTVHS